MNVGKVSLYVLSKHPLVCLIAQANTGSTFQSFMTQHEQVEIDNQGWGTFTCLANHVQIWVREKDRSY